MKLETVATDKAPKAVGPYSQAIRAGDLVFVSGQIPLRPDTGQLVEGDIVPQTDQVMRNLAAILEAAGTGLSRVVKTTIYLKNLEDFGRCNEVYSKALDGAKPARATVQVARLPKDALVEIDAVAILA